MSPGPKSYRNGSLIRTSIKTTDLQFPLYHTCICADLFGFLSEAPGSPTVTVDIEATSITVNWTKPADDGGSPITAYRVLILRGNTEIENRNITDLTAMQLDIGGLTKSTNYTIKLFARNYVFEGNAAEKKFQTKYQGMKVCTKNALRVHKNCIQSVALFKYSLIFINTSDHKLNIALSVKLECNHRPSCLLLLTP